MSLRAAASDAIAVPQIPLKCMVLIGVNIVLYSKIFLFYKRNKKFFLHFKRNYLNAKEYDFGFGYIKNRPGRTGAVCVTKL
jgi:hypothetical protein